jgi:hypothetical protein
MTHAARVVSGVAFHQAQLVKAGAIDERAGVAT